MTGFKLRNLGVWGDSSTTTTDSQLELPEVQINQPRSTKK